MSTRGPKPNQADVDLRLTDQQPLKVSSTAPSPPVSVVGHNPSQSVSAKKGKKKRKIEKKMAKWMERWNRRHGNKGPQHNRSSFKKAAETPAERLCSKELRAVRWRRSDTFVTDAEFFGDMNNVTVLTLRMTAYDVMDDYKHQLFTVFFLLYLTAMLLNSLFISAVHLNKELHQPMNVFACMLSVNEIYGSSGLLPAVMVVLASETREVSVQWCLAQVFFLHTYAGGEFCILALMGYDRYVAICYPLHYTSNMSHSKICRLIALVGSYSLVVFGCFYSLTLRLRLCGKEIPKLYCVNMELVKNACTKAPYISVTGLVLVIAFVGPQLAMILFSYLKIANVCRKLNKESQIKAVKTCIPHLLSLLNYFIGSLFEIIQARFNMTHVPFQVRIFLSLYFIIIPSVANPMLYGIGTQIIRTHILKLFIRYKFLIKKGSR